MVFEGGFDLQETMTYEHMDDGFFLKMFWTYVILHNSILVNLPKSPKYM
jgi:hypothetical protein